MTVCLLTIGDGRDEYHDRSIESAFAHLPISLITDIVGVDDRAHELGFAGAIQQGWDKALATGADWIFHLEADFTFNQPVPLARMIAVLEHRPYLAQIVLKRQAWNEQERAAGGIIEQHPGDYEDRCELIPTSGPAWNAPERREHWVQHRRFFSTNPCVYPARIARLGWPQVPQSEGMFTHKLLKDPHLRFAFWGARNDGPLVHHIGDERAGRGY